MRSIAFIVAASAACLFAQESVQAGLLSAPGFEAPAAPDATASDSFTPLTAATQNPWYGPRQSQQAYSNSSVPFNSGNPTPPPRNRIAAPATNTNPASAYEGTQYGYGFSVGSTFGFLAQNVTNGVIAGDTYTGSAYFMNKAASGTDGDRLQGGSADTVRLSFLDASGAQIGATAISPNSVSSSSTQNVWTPLSVTATAPAGTVAIMFQAYLARGTAGGVMFVDGADLVDVTAITPEPVSCLAVSASAALFAGRRRR